MAPFKQCTMCEMKTRKVVRDGLTWKKVYVCPACYKSQEYIEKNNRKKAYKKEECRAKKNAEKERCQNNVKEEPSDNKENDKKDTPKKRELKLDNQVKVNEVHVKDEKPIEKYDKPTEKYNKPNEKAEELILPNDMVEEMPLNDTTNVSNSPKIRPPIMEIVVINSRKYIVVSETADDDESD